MANSHNPNVLGELYQMAIKKIAEARPAIRKARDELLSVLRSEN